jgi:ketosteroid isomerase-like protein
MTSSEDLLHTSDAIRRALVRNDVDALLVLIAEDYCGFDPAGNRQDRSVLLQAYAPGGVQLTAFETSDVTTKLVGDVGLVMGLGILNGRYQDHAFAHHLRFLDVYVRRGHAWLLLVSQVAELPTATTLPASMVTGKASSAKAAVGDKPVFAYIASLPQPQRGIAQSVDALAAKTLPGLQRSVKWGMSYYGVGDGWCFCCGGFAGHVKLMFMNGVALKPVPPVTPVAMGKSTRGVELTSVDELDERQIAAWMKQVTAVPGVGKKR